MASEQHPADSRPRSKRRFTGLTAILASGAAVAAIVTIPAYISAESENGSAASGTASLNTTAIPGPAAIEKLWPKAVHEIPGRLADGRKALPRLMVDTTRVLLTAESDFEKADSLYIHDLAGGKTTKIADVPTPEGTVRFADGFTAAHGQIAWWTVRGTDGKTADIWTVPDTGGETRLVTSVALPSDGGLTAVAVTPTGFAWSTRDDGVFTVGRDGGTPQQIAGTRGQHIMNWPWVGSPAPTSPRVTPYQSLMNVSTGEKRGQVASEKAKGSPVACGISLCVERPDDSASVQVLGRDGKARRAMDLAGVHPQALQRDRFVFAHFPDRALVHDVQTGTSAEVTGIDTTVRYRTLASSNMMLFKRGDNYLVVDLAAI